MMKNYCSIASSLFLLAVTACQNRLETEEVSTSFGKGDTEMITAAFGDSRPAQSQTKVEIASRSGSSTSGKFSWSEGDALAVWFQNGSTGAWSVASVDVSNSQVEVTGTGQRAKIAIYPASARSDFNMVSASNSTYPNVTKIVYPSEMDYVGKTDDYAPMPMIAVNDASSTRLNFYHVGGLIRIKLYSIPQGTMYIRMTSASDPIAGEFPLKITGSSAGSSLVYTKASWISEYSEASWTSLFGGTHQNTVDIKISESGISSELSGIIVNLPVPTGTYGNFTITPLNSSKQSLASGDFQAVTAPADNWACARANAKELDSKDLRRVYPTKPATYVPGLFSVSKTKRVYFASGNLMVTQVNNGKTISRTAWAFESTQYNDSHVARSPGSGVTAVSTQFGWATAGVKNPAGGYGYDSGHVNYQPHNSSSTFVSNNNSTGFGPSLVDYLRPYLGWASGISGADVADNTWNYDSNVHAYCDWGVHFNDNGVGNENTKNGTWYTLSKTEWAYLIDYRENASILKGAATIHDDVTGTDYEGWIFCWDGWEVPSGCSFTPGSSQGYRTNVYTISANSNYNGLWSSMQQSGVVFLPEGRFWSSSARGVQSGTSSNAYYLEISDYLVSVSNFVYNRSSNGFRVRLVHD